MIIDGIKKRIKELGTNENYSDFVLVDDKLGRLNEVLPLENKTSNIEKDELMLTDKDGNILLTSYNKTTICYVDKNEIVISTKSHYDDSPICITHYRYNKDKKALEPLNIIKSEENGLFQSVYVPSNQDGIIIIRTLDKKYKENDQVYSVNKGRFITPKFTNIQVVRKDLFKFKDEVESNQTIFNKKIKTNIIGFINTDGIFHNEIYVGHKNDIVPVELNTHDNFMQYNAYKRSIARDLDVEVDRLIEKRHTQNRLIKSLENNALNNK